MIPALAFIPPNDTVDTFERLTDLIRNQYVDVTDEFLITLKILTLVGTEETQLELPQISQLTCGVCFIELVKSYPAQITI